MHIYLLVLLSASIVNSEPEKQNKLKEAFKWKYIDYLFPNDKIRNSLLDSGRYIPANNSLLGVAVWRDKCFLTVPRYFDGVPCTLNYIEIDGWGSSPLLNPYPDYESNDIFKGNVEEKIVSASRMFVDVCDRLWVLDNGQEKMGHSSPTVLAAPKILIFDLTTNDLIKTFLLDKFDSGKPSVYFEIIVEVKDNDCDNAYAYIADVKGCRLLVYGLENDTMDVVSNSYFCSDSQSFYTQLQFNGGLTGMALSAVNPDGFRTLYFHALSSINEYKVSTGVLRNSSLSSNSSNYHLCGNRGERGLSTTQRLDEKTGVMFYTQILKNGIGCWNSKLHPTEYSDTNSMVDSDRELFTFPSSLTVDGQGNVWVLSNNFLSFAMSTLNPNEFNYVVTYGNIEDLIKDTKCEGGKV